MPEIDASNSPKVGASLVRVLVFILLGGALLVGFAQWRDRSQGISIPAGATRVDVQLSDYRITLTPAPLTHGRLAFVVNNAGSIPHELVVFRTDAPANRLPLRADGDANEESEALTSVVDSGASLAPGETKVFAANLAAGHYVAVCNLPGHYRLGMRLDLTVG